MKWQKRLIITILIYSISFQFIFAGIINSKQITSRILGSIQYESDIIHLLTIESKTIHSGLYSDIGGRMDHMAIGFPAQFKMESNGQYSVFFLGKGMEGCITYGSNIELVYENIVSLCRIFQILGR